MSRLHTILITSDPELAALACTSGVDEVMVDLETLGKAARQGHLDSWKSQAGPDDIARVRPAVPDGRLLVRVDPLHDGTPAQVEGALARGADALMLPMYRDADTVARFRDLVAGRARIVPLTETVRALDGMAEVAALGPDRVHIGLNDLSLDLGQGFMFQPLADGLLDTPADVLRAAGIPFGIGGVARAGGGDVPAEVILGEHVRLGSTWAILSRAFHGKATTAADLPRDFDFRTELDRLRAAFDAHAGAPPAMLEANRAAFRTRVAAVLSRK